MKDNAQNDVVIQHLISSMMNEMSKRHENEQLIHDIQMFNRKNIVFDE